MRVRIYASSLLISVALVALVSAIASIPSCSALGCLLLPGMLLAALVFPEGVHSDSGIAYLVLAGLIDIVLFALVLMWLWRLAERRRAANEARERSV
jgi:hypothetical protein